MVDLWILLTTLFLMGALAVAFRYRAKQTREIGQVREVIDNDDQQTANQKEEKGEEGEGGERKKDKKERKDRGEEGEGKRDKKDKKDKKKDVEEPPEVIEERKRVERACTDCPYPCEEHTWLPDALQDKIKWMPLSIAGKVKPYKRHFLVCSGVSSALWPADVEEDVTSFPSILGTALKARKAEIGYNVRMTVCDLPSERSDGFDIIVFPSMITLLHVTKEQIPDLVQKLLVEKLHPKDAGILWKPYEHEACLMICAHKLRDKRCGVAGPLLAHEFHRQCHDRGLDDVAVVQVSHFGGHKYARDRKSVV